MAGQWASAGVATQALTDHDWQAQTRMRLDQAGKRLADLLQRQGLSIAGGTGLFQWAPLPEADFWQDALARRGILARAGSPIRWAGKGLGCRARNRPGDGLNWRWPECGLSGCVSHNLALH